MSEYQVIARKFRPQTFKEVFGQEAVVTTLKNAIKFKRLAQAYLFCGSRGTGKTTLARIFAKAINCQNSTEDFEPCNQCTSCREITSGSSLDVLEIDGASHRGIEDIRQINETVGYAATSGQYKVYIIDEVHMLTKEAFNALLKTLEEPPPKVKFIFATTEAHKVLPTILSRCQRFNLSRIPLSQIMIKLKLIADQLEIDVEEEALQLLAYKAEGGLRDAESLFDQIVAFSEGKINAATVQSILGLMPREAYFELDLAGKEGNFVKAFEIAYRIFAEGKDLNHFIEGLIDHFRHILLIQLAGITSPLLTISPKEKQFYERAAHLYTQEQCLDLIDYLIESAQQIRFTHSGKIALEAILLHVIRSHFRLPIEVLVQRLGELEQMLGEASLVNSSVFPPLSKSTPQSSLSTEVKNPPLTPPVPLTNNKPSQNLTTSPIEKNLNSSTATSLLSPSTNNCSLFDHFVSEDPTPTQSDLGRSTQKLPNKDSPSLVAKLNGDNPTPVHQYDTLFQFAAIELEGKLQRKA
ncbi:DNA polymerase III subunit gamma/tau [Candidatus Protochlamydia amoebophila]|uniref:DNA polymerase III subunit gamma/tau n=1 Tax=Protochlamydia amoebophila (strain UWE25) TaxID=264201 RepID=Q6MDZ7_PARUW|nr:DNA polymerase III subunit gamma/tau [Candidatus Protochlamydia amoebophila]CAF23202.1 unnamed protein product [Candidatus Protochlamydia amoebophila UWE25]